MLGEAPAPCRPRSAGEGCFDQICGQMWVWPLWSKVVDMRAKKISWSRRKEALLSSFREIFFYSQTYHEKWPGSWDFPLL